MWLWSGLFALEEKQDGRAQHDFEQAKTLCGDEIKFQLELGRYLTSRKNFKAAQKAYQHILEIDPTHRQAKKCLAHLFFTTGHFFEAKTFAHEVYHSSEHPSINTLRVIAVSHYHLNEIEPALEAFLNMVQLDDALIEPHVYIAALSLKCQDLNLCISACDRLLQHLGLKRDVTLQSLAELGSQFFSIAEALHRNSETHLMQLCLETGQQLLSSGIRA